MKLIIEYTRDELARRLRTETTDEELDEAFRTAIHESMAEWRQQNLATTDPRDLPLEVRLAVKAMLGAEIIVRDETPCEHSYPMLPCVKCGHEIEAS